MLAAPGSCTRPSRAVPPGSVAELSCQKIIFDLQLRQILETEHEVIDEAHQVRLALALWFELLLEPQVQGVVQIDVGEHTGDRSALRSSLLGTNNDPILHRSGLEPLTNQAQDHRISDALPDHPL